MAPPKDTNDKDEHDKSKLWRWSDGYKYPLPKPSDDHWKIILEPLLRQDNSRCDAWKDEVQNLLIFAGLFSAVVTGFVIESYKNLTPDPNDAMIAVLSRIAEGIDNLANGTSMAVPLQGIPETISFSPAQSAVRINVLWFSSLILSLVTVVVGTVSLQWLREHQRYIKPLTSRKALAIFHLRSESLKRWRVRHIFTFLPLLLQGAVILFFVGLVEFLAALNDVVAGVAIALIGLSLLFLVGTTALPTLQLLIVTFSSISNGSIPAQCPYKSPQAWAFRHIFIAFISIPTFAYHHLQRIYWPLYLQTFVKKLRDISPWSGRNRPANFSSSSVNLPLNLSAEYSRQHWIDFDIFWLSIREKRYLLKQRQSIEYDTDPIYDLVHALSYLAQDHSEQEEFAFANYHAYKELLDTLINDRNKALFDVELDNNTEESKLEGQLEILQSPFSPLRSAYFQQDSTSLRAVRDEMLFLFMNLPGIKEYSSLPDHPVGLHKLELFTRMLVCKFFYRCNEISADTRVNPTHQFLISVEKSYPKRIWEIPEPFIVDMVKQHYWILRHIFEQASTLLLGNPQAMITIMGYPELANFFEHAAWIPIPEILESNFSTVLKIIHNGLILSLESHVPDRADFLFFCARLYLEKVARHHWFLDFMKANQYKKIHQDILRVLKVMVYYEQKLDKVTYVRLENLWRAELYPSNHATTIPGPTQTVNSQFYYAIPEVLRRFIPYEQLSPPTDDRDLSTIQLDYDSSIEVQVEGLNGDICYLPGGEAMTFLIPGESSSLESG